MAAESLQHRLKTLSFGTFPEVILLKVFSNLSVQELARALSVCKQWNNVARSDILWKKFVPKSPGFVPPNAPSMFQTVMAMWKSSITIGNERWYPNPLPELVRYESRLRKAEYHQNFKWNSETALFLRLNPIYKFNSRGKDIEDTDMKEICNEIWVKLGDQRKDVIVLELETIEKVMEHAEYITKNEATEKVLQEIEPGWFLEELNFEPRELDDDGNIVNVSPDEDDEEIQEDDLGGVALSEDESVFGPWDEPTAWTSKVNKRLTVHLYGQLKAVLFDGSRQFIVYYLNDGYLHPIYEYAFYVVVTDTAVFYIKHFN